MLKRKESFYLNMCFVCFVYIEDISNERIAYSDFAFYPKKSFFMRASLLSLNASL